MKDETYYKKVFIRSTEDLPKEHVNREFYAHNVNTNTISKWSIRNKSQWLDRIDWYLQPVSPTLRREKVIEVLKKWMSYNHNETYESIASELCDAGEREESPKELIPDTSKGAKQYNFTEVDPIIEAMQKEYLIQAENLFFDGIETKPPIKDIPPECRSCGHRNSESCNTCPILNPQFDGV